LSLREHTGSPGTSRDLTGGSLEQRVPPARYPDLKSLSAQAGAVAQIHPPTAEVADRLYEQAASLHAGRQVLSNILKLAGGEAVVVASMHRAVLYGGLISDIGKALTTVKLASELERKGVPSVPVLCLAGHCRNELEVQTLGFVDPRGDYLEFTFNLIREPGPNGQGDLLVSTEAGLFLDRLDAYLGPGIYDAAVRQLLKQTHAPGTRLAPGWAMLISALLEEWGVMVLDLDGLPGRSAASGTDTELEGPAQLTGGRPLNPKAPGSLRALHKLCWLLPVAAVVAGPREPDGWTEAAHSAPAADLQFPAIWPQASLTLVDRRSRGMLAKYQVPFDDLSDGLGAPLQRVLPEAVIRQATRRLGTMERELEGCSSELRHLLGPDRASKVKLEKTLRRIHYQISKLEERCKLHHQRRLGILRRQFERICNRLSPNGQLQQSQIAVLQVLHDYSRAAFRELFDKMDVGNFEHQLIPMD
jgi:uncharacterized protein YllA (UPF0747 family)